MQTVFLADLKTTRISAQPGSCRSREAGVSILDALFALIVLASACLLAIRPVSLATRILRSNSDETNNELRLRDSVLSSMGEQ